MPEGTLEGTPDNDFIAQLKAALSDPNIRSALQEDLKPPPPDSASLERSVVQAEQEAAKALAATAKTPYTPDFTGKISFNGQVFSFTEGETRDYPVIIIGYIQQQRAEHARMQAAHAQLADKNIFLGSRE